MPDVSQGLTDLPRTYVRRRYAILFYTLLLTFVCSPLLSTLNRSGVLMELLPAGSLCAAVLPVGAVRRRDHDRTRCCGGRNTLRPARQ